jgi:hypothetical protein
VGLFFIIFLQFAQGELVCKIDYLSLFDIWMVFEVGFYFIGTDVVIEGTVIFDSRESKFGVVVDEYFNSGYFLLFVEDDLSGNLLVHQLIK